MKRLLSKHIRCEDIHEKGEMIKADKSEKKIVGGMGGKGYGVVANQTTQDKARPATL